MAKTNQCFAIDKTNSVCLLTHMEGPRVFVRQAGSNPGSAPHGGSAYIRRARSSEDTAMGLRECLRVN
jgi:hypothetical protein